MQFNRFYRNETLEDIRYNAAKRSKLMRLHSIEHHQCVTIRFLGNFTRRGNPIEYIPHPWRGKFFTSDCLLLRMLIDTSSHHIPLIRKAINCIGQAALYFLCLPCCPYFSLLRTTDSRSMKEYSWLLCVYELLSCYSNVKNSIELSFG